jgi:CheY-like chemotaxis protein
MPQKPRPRVASVLKLPPEGRQIGELDSRKGEPRPKSTRLPTTPFQTLKRVSGRLGRLLRRHELAPREGPAQRHLLVVDDEESICFSMREYFSQHGFQVDTAREAGEAEKLIEQTEYAVIIQDLRLGASGRHEGIDVIRLAHRHNPRTRIVVLTAYGSAETEQEALRVGADVFLRKPKPLSQVAQVIQGLIESPRNRSVPHC